MKISRYSIDDGIGTLKTDGYWCPWPEVEAELAKKDEEIARLKNENELLDYHLKCYVSEPTYAKIKEEIAREALAEKETTETEEPMHRKPVHQEDDTSLGVEAREIKRLKQK